MFQDVVLAERALDKEHREDFWRSTESFTRHLDFTLNPFIIYLKTKKNNNKKRVELVCE